MSSLKSNEAWLQTSILYEILPLNRVEEMYSLSMQICKIHRYEAFVNMFVFSLNRLTPGRGGGGGGGGGGGESLIVYNLVT